MTGIGAPIQRKTPEANFWDHCALLFLFIGHDVRTCPLNNYGVVGKDNPTALDDACEFCREEKTQYAIWMVAVSVLTGGIFAIFIAIYLAVERSRPPSYLWEISAMLNGVARSVGQANKPVFGPNAPVLVGDPLDLLCEYLLKPIPRGTEVSYDGKSFSANSWPDLFSQIIQFQIRNFKKPLLSVAFRSGDFGRDDGTKIKESLRKISHGGLASIVEPNNPLIANGSVWFRLFEKLWIMEQIERLNAIIESYTRIKNNVSALQKIMDEARILLKDFSSIASQGSMPKYLREVNWNVETSGENFLRKGEICAAHKEFDASLQNEINEFMAEKADLERLLRLPIPLQDQSIMLFGVCFVCWVEEKHRETGIREK